MRKKISVLLVCTMLLAALTGCFGEIVSSTIHSDGSGSITFAIGFTEEAMKLMAQLEEEDAALDTGDMDVFTYHGQTYYGEKETVEFESVEEFNELISILYESEDAQVDTGTIHLDQKEDGSFHLMVVTNEETGMTTELEETYPEESLSEADLAALLAGMAVVFEFDFPAAVTQTAGFPAGVTIQGSKLTLDFLAIAKAMNGEPEILQFETKPVQAIPQTGFIDVPQTKWFYNAITALCDGGLVTGMGTGRFAPDATLTYAQLCAMLCNAEGVPASRVNGYWAGGAINYCITSGYIKSRGEICAENYNVPVTREAAVAAMYLAAKPSLGMPDRQIDESFIPDFSSISETYQDQILQAYNFNITDGMDANHTFRPQGYLTRAQVCQLFYNIGWTTKK